MIEDYLNKKVEITIVFSSISDTPIKIVGVVSKVTDDEVKLIDAEEEPLLISDNDKSKKFSEVVINRNYISVIKLY